MKNKPNKIDFIVYDEVHTAKNPNSDQGANLLKTKAKY
jgi:superfamily II DNA or RNA helicase